MTEPDDLQTTIDQLSKSTARMTDLLDTLAGAA